jgi:phage terminase large subunit
VEQTLTSGFMDVSERLMPEDFGIVTGERRVPWVTSEEHFRAIGYEPYRQQREFHAAKERFKVVAGAKRIGKSFMGAREVESLIVSPMTHGWVVGVTYRRAVKEFEYILQDLTRTLRLGTLEKNFNVRGGYMNITFPWDSKVEVRSAKDENDLEAEALDWVIIAEPAQHRESTFELLRERVAEKKGVMILPGTPPVARHWMKKRFDWGQDPGREDYYSIQIPATETPYPGLDEVRKLKAELSPLRYRRDCLAEFVATDDILYSTFEYPVHVDDLEYNRDLPLYWAFDFGWSHPWVCLWVQVDRGAERVYVLREYYQRRMTDSDNIDAVREIHRDLGWSRTLLNVADPRSPGARAELENHGVEITGMAGSQRGDVDRRTELVRQKLAIPTGTTPGLVVDRSCENLIDEFTLHDVDPKTGKERDADNDGLDALGYLMLELFDEGSDDVGIAWA